MHDMVLPYYENIEEEIARKQHEKDVEKKLKRYLNKIGKKLRWSKKKKENIFRFLNRELYRSAIEEIYEVMPSPYTVYELQKDKKTCPCLLTCVVTNRGFDFERYDKFYFDDKGNKLFRTYAELNPDGKTYFISDIPNTFIH